MRNRAGVVAIAAALTVAAACGGSSTALTDDDVATAIEAVEASWGECLDLVGVTADDAIVVLVTAAETGRPIDRGARPVAVDLGGNVLFLVQLDGTLEGAAVGSQEAEDLLDRASALGGDCG